MELKFLIISLVYFQVATSQYYEVPAVSYPSYYNSYYPAFTPVASNIASNTQRYILPTSSAKLPKLQPKRSVGNTAPVKTSPQTASAYFLGAPKENIKATVLRNEKIGETNSPVPYSCPLCNNFADVPRNSKLQPPPAISPVLPGILDTVPTISIPKNLTTKDPSAILAASKTSIPDMCEKHKVAKKLSFDQELLEGFLTGLGLAL